MMAKRTTERWLLAGLILPIALLFIVPPAFKLWGYTQHRRASVTTQAEVVRTEDSVFTLPVLRFTDHQGVVHEFKSEIPFYFLWAPKPGDHLTVHFRRDAPEIVRTQSFIHYIFYPVVFLIAGLALFSAVAVKRPRSPRE